MVDASATFERLATAPGSRTIVREAAGRLTVQVLEGQEAVAAYVAAARGASWSPPQGPSWIGAWMTEARPDAVVAILSFDARPVLALALEVTARGPFRIAAFMGGSHANGSFVPLQRDAIRLGRGDVDRVLAAIRAYRPDIDVILLERLLDEHDGMANPFLALPSLPSPNISLATDLEGGFEALLKRSSGKRKRKKHRSQTRKFEAAGGHRLIEADDEVEVDRVLTAFFEMKRIRLTKMGVEDVFGTENVQRFFRTLFKEALRQPRPDFVLHGLEVGGELRAVTGSSRTTGRIICEFGAIREDELSNASPGDFLFFENIKAACDEGLELYDFSVGDELYKRLWCDVETVHHDVLVPLSLKGRVFGFAFRSRSRLKAFVKNNAFLWSLLKRLRRKENSPATEATGDAEE